VTRVRRFFIEADAFAVACVVAILLAGDKSGEREQGCVTRKCWDVRSLSVAAALLVILALATFALAGCLQITINAGQPPTADNVQVEPQASVTPQAFEVHAL
jgi:hypothetical protein